MLTYFTIYYVLLNYYTIQIENTDDFFYEFFSQIALIQ